MRDGKGFLARIGTPDIEMGCQIVSRVPDKFISYCLVILGRMVSESPGKVRSIHHPWPSAALIVPLDSDVSPLSTAVSCVERPGRSSAVATMATATPTAIF
jgi:hypothetical protein